MPRDESASTDSNPQPSVTPGLEPGGGVAPGDTPPASDSMSGALGEDRKHNSNMGPVSGNRTPMIIALVLIGLLVLGTVGYGIAQISGYVNNDPGGDQASMGTVSSALIR